MLDERPYVRVTPSNDSLDEAASPPPAAFRSFHSLTGTPNEGFFASASSAAVFEVLVWSRGSDAPVEIYYGVETPSHVETVKRNLRDIYPDSFNVERAMQSPHKQLVTPVRLSTDDFVDRLRAGDLLANVDDLAVSSPSTVPDGTSHPRRDEEFVDDGTHVAVSPASTFEGESDAELVELDGPTLTSSGEIYARPSIESVEPQGARWESRARRKQDWMTCFETTTLGRETDEMRIDWAESSTPTLQSILTAVGGASVPTVVQFVFEPKAEWTAEAELRKRRIREQRDTLTQRVAGMVIPSGSDGTKSEAEYTDAVRRRLAHLSAKNPKRTFTLNVRAAALPEQPRWEVEDDDGIVASEGVSEAARVLDQLETTLDSFAGEFVELTPQRATAESTPTATTLTQRLFERELVTAKDDSLARRVLSSSRRRVGIVVNPTELARLCTVPSGQNLPVSVSRDTRTRKQESVPLPRPTPDLIEPFSERGMTIGHALDETGAPRERVQIPQEVLTRHYARFAASGAGKSIGIINDILSLHQDTTGPVILVDPKGDGMSTEYVRAHYSEYDSLDTVHHFEVPEDLPAVAFFDIRPALAAGLNRETAIKDVVERFHAVMKVVMGREAYTQAYVATQIIGKLVKALFDPEYGADAYTLDELLTAVDDMQRSQSLPELSHAFVDLEQSLGAHFEKPDRQFQTTMDAARNRLEQIADDPPLERIFNHVPAFDWETGMYAHEEPGLDFRRLLDQKAVVLFDLGKLRPKPQRGMTLFLVSELWYRIQLEEQAYDGYRNQANLILEEAADVVASELVTEQVIPKARSFGLSLGLVMQYPSQVREVSERAYQEVMNNVQTRLYGKLANETDVESMLASSRVNTEEVRDRLNAMPRGEWIAELPSPQYGSKHLRPFSVSALDIPPGHSESHDPVTESDPEFKHAYESMTERVAESMSVSLRGLETESNDRITVTASVGDSETDSTETVCTDSTVDADSSQFSATKSASAAGENAEANENTDWEAVLEARDEQRTRMEKQTQTDTREDEPTDPDSPNLSEETQSEPLGGVETEETEARREPQWVETRTERTEATNATAGASPDTTDSTVGTIEEEVSTVSRDAVEDSQGAPSSPIPSAYSPKTDEELSALGLTRDDEQFLLLVLRAMNGDLEDYHLLDSMTSLRDEAGDPDVDLLKSEGYVEQHRVRGYRYYTVLPDGRSHLERTQTVSPGEGDLGEKTPHKVGVAQLTQAFEIHPDVDRVEPYHRASEDAKYDVAGFDSDGQLVRVGEVETPSHNRDSIVDDFTKLRESDGVGVWAVLNGKTAKLVTETLAERGYISEDVCGRSTDIRDNVAERDIDGLQQIETYSQLDSRLDL